MSAKIKFIQYILALFSHDNIKTKLYLIVRIVIFPIYMFQKISPILDPNSKVLDIWCGFGILSLYLKHNWHKGDILWLDYDPKRIKALNQIVKKHKIKNLWFIQRDLITQGFKWLKWYDTAILVDLLHHIDIKTQEKLLTHLANNIKTIIIKDIDIKPRFKYYRNFFHDRYLMRNKVLHFQWHPKIKKYLENLWFKVTYQKINSIFPYPHFLLIAKK